MPPFVRDAWSTARESRRETIDGGLVRAAGDVLYPIVDQIPVLLVDESIALSQLRGRFIEVAAARSRR